MNKLHLLEQHVMIRSLRILPWLLVIGAISYALLAFSMLSNDTVPIVISLVSLISMSLLTGAAGALLIFQLGLQRLRSGL